MEIKKPNNWQYLEKVKAENAAENNTILSKMKNLENTFHSTQELADLFFPVSDENRRPSGIFGAKPINPNGERLYNILNRMHKQGLLESKKIGMKRVWKIFDTSKNKKH